jgi:hypothetical protein
LYVTQSRLTAKDFEVYDRVVLKYNNFGDKWSYGHLRGQEATVISANGDNHTNSEKGLAIVIVFDREKGHYGAKGVREDLNERGGWVVHTSDLIKLNADNEDYLALLSPIEEDDLPSLE